MLNERKRAILRAVVQDYIRRAEPVGSRALSRRYNLGISPATIRNEMADLSEMGYLEQPHTSAGRIPSYQGYRYYVDCLMQAEDLTTEEEEILSASLKQMEKLDVVFRQATRVLSQVSQYTSLVMTPFFGQQVFRQMRILPIDSRFVVVVLLTDGGLVQNKVMEIPPGVSPGELDQIAKVFTERLAGTPLEQLNNTLLQDLYVEFSRQNRNLRELLEDLIMSFNYPEGERVYLGGTTNILKQPEFSDVEKVRDLLQLLEEQEFLCELLTDRASEEMAITIGEENNFLQMKDCSIVTARYEIKGRTIGAIGILGPTRMDYARVVSVVGFMQKQLSETLRKLLG